MQTSTISHSFTLRFEHLPVFADYLMGQRMHEFAAYQLKLSHELEVPLLKRLNSLTEEQLLQMVMESNKMLLTHLAQNNARQQIEEAVQMWLNNQYPQIDKYQVEAEDITLGSYIRKNTFLQFIPGYTQNVQQVIDLIAEIDAFIMASETALTNTYLKLLQNRINEDSHFIQQINNTTPGAIYVFDVVQYKSIYSNGKLKEVLGYEHHELNGLGNAVFTELIHPEDKRLTQKNVLQVASLQDGQIQSYKFRVKQSDGNYRWVRIYESVFKRDETGRVTQTISIALNVDKEKKMADQLAKREHQLLEAQDIAQIGSYVWDITSKQLEGTPKLYQLLEVKGNDYQSVIEKAGEAESQKLIKAFETAVQTGRFECEFRYRGSEGEKVLWSKAVVNYNDEGNPVSLTGTLMDITERNNILEHLQQSEKRFKLAEALANIGHYEIDLQTNMVKMSDELYRIYGLQPQEEPMDYALVTQMRHPDDEAVVNAAVTKALQDKKPFSLYFRIITKDQNQKIVRARGEVITDANGQPVQLVGTIQDVTEKQQLLEKLKHSDYMYKQAEEMANMGNYSMNTLTGDIEWTDHLYKIYGLEPQSEKITEARFYEFIHPEDKASVKESVEVFYKTGKADYTFRILTPQGEEKILRSIAQLQNDDKGRPVIVIGTELDITENRRLVNSLEKSQWLNRQAQAIAHLGNWSFNIKTGETYWSEELYRIYEIPNTEKVSYELFISFVHPDDKEDVIAYYQQCLQNKTTYNKRHRIVLRNGKIKTLHRKGELHLDADGEVVEFFGTTQDITEQQAAENELLEKQNMIQKIADATPTILYLFNTVENKFVYINREVFYVLGYTSEEILEAGAAATELIYHPEDYNLLPERAQSTRKFQHRDSMVQYECRMKNKNGELCWLLVREVMFKCDDGGNIVEILGAALDISKRKEMEKTLLQNAYQLEQSNASLEEFAYVASHDLKEPLRKISTFGDRLLHTQLEHLNEEGKTYLNKIVDASQRMQLMISDLLSISMITGDRGFEPFSLQLILNEVLQTLEFKIEQKGAVINAGNLPTINIIPSQFRQLFQNLLSNSLKFVREGVQPVITITHTFLQPEEVEHLQLTKASSYLKLKFSDNGIGFEDEYAVKIFAIFQRLHGRSEYEGTGIGLAICKKIVEHHGGIIYASAQQQQGATFTIILPV